MVNFVCQIWATVCRYLMKHYSRYFCVVAILDDINVAMCRFWVQQIIWPNTNEQHPVLLKGLMEKRAVLF